MKSTTKKSFQMSGPLRSVRVSGGASGVRVALNGQEVVNVRNSLPAASSAATSTDGATSAADELANIKVGRFIADQQSDQPAQKSTDDEKEKGQEIVVGPITPIPSPKPILAPRPARLGL